MYIKKMKFIILITFVLFSFNNYGQENLCRKDLLNGNQVIENNQNEKYSKFDFSSLWIKTENELVYGIIGDDYQRIFMKFIFVEKTLNNPYEYLVYGKSSVKSSVCDFIGKITIIKIQEFKNQNFGIDDEYKNSGIKSQGLLTAKYELFENKEQNHSGQFQGTLQTKWYLDKENLIKYNDINLNSDGYFNNAFVGTWKMYKSKIEKICNWGDYRVPYTKCDFDIGAGELSISEKYSKNGWLIKLIKEWWK
jgi:hypothetical protein